MPVENVEDAQGLQEEANNTIKIEAGTRASQGVKATHAEKYSI